MGFRVRMGPVSVSSRGRVGVSAGPVTIYGGARRRRGSRAGSRGGGSALLLALVALGAIGLAIEYWYVSIPVALALAVVVMWSRRRARTRRQEAEQAWLGAPAPPLAVPSRFTDRWFAANVPVMHPGQVPALLAALRSRGWSNEKIAERVGPHLSANPHVRTRFAEEA